MRHANSNLNILKKNRNSKTIKLNNFLKPPTSSNNFNSPITSKNSHNKNILYNLLNKDNSKISLYITKNTTNAFKNINEISKGDKGKHSLSNKNLFNNSISSGNSLNYKDNNIRHGHINIRLNLNNKIINNNFRGKKKSKHKTINLDMIEKIKEKDSQINKLQKDLFQSQELLNKLQKEKQKELNFTFNSFKSLDNINNYKKDYQLSDFFIPTSEKNDKILKTNFNKFEINKSKKKLKYMDLNKKTNKSNVNNKNLKTLLKIDSLININSNYSIKNRRNNNKNFLSGFHKNNYKNKFQHNFPTSNYLKCFSSSAKRLFPHGHEQYESCISLTRNNFKSNTKKNLYSPKQNNIITLSPSKKNFTSSTFKNLIKKCNLLKTKANNILANYISLTEYVIKNSNQKNKYCKK